MTHARAKTWAMAALLAAAFALPGCSGDDSSSNGDSSGPAAGDAPRTAREVLEAFLAPDADQAALFLALKPEPEDYKAVFTDDVADQVRAAYAGMWIGGPGTVRKPEQTQLLLWSATPAELAAGSGDAQHFPGGYQRVAGKYRDGVTIYRFKFVEPGNDIGMAWDGLIHVNGRWVIFPKPWRAIPE